MPQPNRRKFRLYAPFAVDRSGARKRYIRLTYTIRDLATGEPRDKSFPGKTLEQARVAYQDILLHSFFYAHSYQDPNDRRRNQEICLRPVPESEQPAV